MTLQAFALEVLILLIMFCFGEEKISDFKNLYSIFFLQCSWVLIGGEGMLEMLNCGSFSLWNKMRSYHSMKKLYETWSCLFSQREEGSVTVAFHVQKPFAFLSESLLN